MGRAQHGRIVADAARRFRDAPPRFGTVTRVMNDTLSSPREQTTPRRGAALLALLLTAPLPSIGTWLAMVALPESTVAKALFMAAKVWLLAAPLLWLRLVERQPLRPPRWSNRGMIAGHATGIVIFLGILAAYLLVGRRWIDTSLMLGKIEQLGLDRWWLYGGFGLYACFVNSLLEEYFWRWFTFRRLQDVIGRRYVTLAVIVAGVLFTLHHIIALSVYFDWRITALASLGVFIGGVTWSTLYLRYGNIYAGWVSHVWADLAIFGLGAWLIFG